VEAEEESDMVAFLVSMVSWLIRIVSSPEAQTVVKIAGDLMAQLPSGMAAKAFVLIKEAASQDGGTVERFEYVFNGLKDAYPDVGENTVRALIELAYGAYKKGQG
jgi:hypothetical protein